MKLEFTTIMIYAQDLWIEVLSKKLKTPFLRYRTWEKGGV
jgi:hypothetical protein